MKYADCYGKIALEQCCHDALIYGKCNYTYITNTITGYIEPEGKNRKAIKQQNQETPVTGTYKDDDSEYSLQNLLRRQEEGDQE